MIKIRQFTNEDAASVISHILSIENNEFNMDLSIDDQPDLRNIAASYIEGGGNFWVAEVDNKVIGTIGLYNLGNANGDLRKMFVSRDYRGAPYNVGQNLFNVLLNWAIDNFYEMIYLETSYKFSAAVKFYLKNNFSIVDANMLPDNFPIIKVAELFMVLNTKKINTTQPTDTSD